MPSFFLIVSLSRHPFPMARPNARLIFNTQAFFFIGRSRGLRHRPRRLCHTSAAFPDRPLPLDGNWWSGPFPGILDRPTKAFSLAWPPPCFCRRRRNDIFRPSHAPSLLFSYGSSKTSLASCPTCVQIPPPPPGPSLFLRRLIILR